MAAAVLAAAKVQWVVEADLKTHPDVIAAESWINDLKKTPENDYRWIVCNLQCTKKMRGKGKLRLIEKGITGLEGLKEVMAAVEDRVHFGLLAVKTSDNAGSSRIKVIRFDCIPVGMSGAARTSTCQSIAKNGPVRAHLNFQCDNQDFQNNTELVQFEHIARRLLSAGGAHPPTQIKFSPEMVYENVLNN